MGVLRAGLLCIALGWWFGFIACLMSFLSWSLIPEGLLFAAWFGGQYGAFVGGVCAPAFAFAFRRKSLSVVAALVFLTVSPCVFILHLLLNFILASLLSILAFLGVCVGVLMEVEDMCEPVGVCQTCEYNLTGNISGICPECGTPLSRAEVTAADRGDDG